MLALLGFAAVAAAQTYRAAVVQYNQPADAGLAENIRAFGALAQSAAAQGAQIIVFPEFAAFPTNFTSYCQDPTDVLPFCEPYPSPGVNPCVMPEAWPIALYEASCMARNASAYLAVNLCDQQPEGNYATELVFGPDGALVAKYHKMHPYFDKCFLTPNATELVSFATDFGVTFGLFVCFDIAFPVPGPELVAQGVRHFAYSSSIPIVGTTVQEAWSALYHSTLLGANLAFGQSGFFVNGSLVGPQPPATSTNFVLVADIPV